MSKILLEEKYVLEYIRDMLSTLKTGAKEVTDARYHHNASYEKIPSILRNGILSLLETNKLGITKYTDQDLDILNDITSHVNGNDSISLSVVGLTDLYPNEDEYNPYSPNYVDLIISSDVKARRSSTRYGNEFLVKDKISTDKIKAVDTRLLRLMEEKRYDVKVIIEKYNHLREIALIIKELNLDVLLREMSEDNLTFDIDKVSKTPQIVLKPKNK